MSNDKKGSAAVEAVARIPNDRLEDLFRESILAKVGQPGCDLEIQEIDLAIRKEVDQSAVFVDMTVYGLAGNTTKDQFAKFDKDGKVATVVKGGGSVSVTLDDDSVVKFVVVGVVNLNATDYLVTYRLA